MFKKTLLATALVLAATQSFAESYFQGSLGKGNVAFDVGSGATSTKSNTGYKLLYGFEAGNGLAYEGQLISYGKQVVTTTANGALSNTTASGFGGNIAYLGKFNDQFSYRAAAGLGINAAKSSATGSNVSTSGLQLTFGGGVAYQINKSIGIIAEYDLSKAKLTNGGVSATSNVSLMSFGVRSSF